MKKEQTKKKVAKKRKYKVRKKTKEKNGRKKEERKTENKESKQPENKERNKQLPECLKNYITRTENEERVHEGQDRNG